MSARISHPRAISVGLAAAALAFGVYLAMPGGGTAGSAAMDAEPRAALAPDRSPDRIQDRMQADQGRLATGSPTGDAEAMTNGFLPPGGLSGRAGANPEWNGERDRARAEPAGNAAATTASASPSWSGADAPRYGSHGVRPRDDSRDKDPEPIASDAIAGWVLDRDGVGIDGVSVLLSPLALHASPSSGASAARASRSTVTSQGGAFDFADLYPGDYRLATRASGDYRDATARVRSGLMAVTLVLIDTAEIRISGRVTDDAGEPIAAARVTAPGGQTSTDAAGAYQLTLKRAATERHMLRFDARGYRTAHLALPTPQQGQARLDATLEPEDEFVALSGWLQDRDGAPVADEAVRLSGGGRHLSARSDASGYFEFPSVASGRDYLVSVTPQGPYRPYRREGFAIGGAHGQTTLDIRLEPQPFAALEGYLVDGARAPLAGFALELRSTENRSWSARAVSDGSGFFTVPTVPAGEITIGTSGQPKLSAEGIQLRPGERRRVRIPVDWGNHDLFGQVLDAGGAPVTGTRVELQWEARQGEVSSRSLRVAHTDAAGWFGFDRLGPGQRQVVVAAQGFQTVRLGHEVGRDPSDIEIVLRR